MKRRKFVMLAAKGTGAAVLSSQIALLSSCDDSVPVTAPEVLEAEFKRKLFVPPVASGSGVRLIARNNIFNVMDGLQAEVLGYLDGSILGPTILANSGDLLQVEFNNSLTEASNIHWHGIFAPANMDGHPRDIVPAGGTKIYNFEILNRAGTYWYHPHPDMRTAEQAYGGLAGFLIVSDQEEQALLLPSGIYDIPLVIQDKNVDANGQFPYILDSNDQKNGLLGNRVIINGLHAPFIEVNSGWYRFRLLNGSNARLYNLSFTNGYPMNIIGTDGGLLAYPEQVNSIILSPGERADILVDLSKLVAGDEFFLQSEAFPGSIYQGKQGFRILKIVATGQPGVAFQLPSQLSGYLSLNPNLAIRKRSFDVSNGGGHSGHSHSSSAVVHVIDGKSYDENRIDVQCSASTFEHWIFDNTIGIDPHPMHLHGALFQVLARHGGRAKVFPHEKGWKDTVLLMPGEKVEILVRFSSHVGVFVFHCHNLEHEDSGMMLQMKLD